jgi:hypothetical protein
LGQKITLTNKKNKMRILLIIHGYPPYYMAGSEVYTYNLARELAKNNEVFVFCRFEDKTVPLYHYYDTTDDEWKSLAVTTTQYAVESGHSVNADTASYAINAATSSYASTADKATKDGVGNTITNTYAPLNSPVFTGTPVVPDVASGDDSSKIANTKFVKAAISASTYSTMTVAEGIEGASTVSKVMTAANLKGMLQGSTYVYSYAPCVEADFDFGELTASGEVYNQ